MSRSNISDNYPDYERVNEDDEDDFDKSDDESEKKVKSKGPKDFTESIKKLGLLGLYGLMWLFIFLAPVALGIAIAALVKVDDISTECNNEKPNLYALESRFDDSFRTDWRSFSRDLQSSAYNPHFKGVDSGTMKKLIGACPGGITQFFVSGTMGVSVTVTLDSDTNMLFLADNGISSSPDNIQARIYGVNLTTCAIVWSKTVTSLGSQISTFGAPVGGNDGTVGVTNPMAKISTSLVATRNETGGLILVFGDTGTSAFYNTSLSCYSIIPNPCGARVYAIEALTGQLIWRNIASQDVVYLGPYPYPFSNYSRQSDTIKASMKVYQSFIYFGIATTQTSEVVKTGELDFFARYFTININTGILSQTPSVNSVSQIQNGNLGAAINGAVAVNPFNDLVIFGTSFLLNQSDSVTSCLAAGYTRKFCLENGINSMQLFALRALPVELPIESTAWRYSPFGASSFNDECLTTPKGSLCPPNNGPPFSYSTGPIVIANECGQTFVASMGNSGTLYFNEGSISGKLIWSTYIGPANNNSKDINYGISFDGQKIYVTVSNLDKKSYLTLNGVLRCDSFWAAVDATSGTIDWISPTPCSRASSECPAIVPDPWLLQAGNFPLSVLDFSNRGPIKYGDAVKCFGNQTIDSRNVPSIGSTAIGPVVTVPGFMFGGSFSGHMHVLDSSNGNLVTSLSRCTTGIVYGGASVGVMKNNEKIITWGCGYGTDGYPSTFGSTEVKVLRVP